MSQYKGKYPTRIRSVSAPAGQSLAYIITNDGRKWTVSAKDTKGEIPSLGQDIAQWPAKEAKS